MSASRFQSAPCAWKSGDWSALGDLHRPLQATPSGAAPVRLVLPTQAESQTRWRDETSKPACKRRLPRGETRTCSPVGAPTSSRRGLRSRPAVVRIEMRGSTSPASPTLGCDLLQHVPAYAAPETVMKLTRISTRSLDANSGGSHAIATATLQFAVKSHGAARPIAGGVGAKGCAVNATRELAARVQTSTGDCEPRTLPGYGCQPVTASKPAARSTSANCTWADSAPSRQVIEQGDQPPNQVVGQELSRVVSQKLDVVLGGVTAEPLCQAFQ